MSPDTQKYFYFAKDLAELIDKYNLNKTKVSSRDLADHLRDQLWILKDLLEKVNND